MHLTIAGERIAVRQLGPDFLIIDPTAEQAPTVGQLYLCVDGNEREWSVFLPEGILKTSRRVMIANV